MMIRKSMKKVISLLLAASMVFTMAGCGGGGGTGTDGQGTGTDSMGSSTDTGNKGQSGNAGEDGPAAMGRYVEEEIDLSEQASSPMDLCMREDGKLVILDRYVGMLVSEDQGATWTEETPDWFPDVKKDAGWISNK